MNYVPPDSYLNQNQQITFPNNQQSPITSSDNSVNANEILELRKTLKSTTTLIKCPFCKNKGFTRVDKSCNAIDGLFCLITLGTLWSCLHICRGKDMNCSDADHYCSGCNNKIGKYSSC
jgi:hypothetical protein